MTLPAGYAKLLALSQCMLTLAKNQEWEKLAQTAEERAQLLPSLVRQPANTGTAETREVAEAIQQIQVIDQEVLDYVRPWREHAAMLLTRLESPPKTKA